MQSNPYGNPAGNRFDDRSSGGPVLDGEPAAGLIRSRPPIQRVLTVTGFSAVPAGAEHAAVTFRAPRSGRINELLLGAVDVADQARARSALKLKMYNSRTEEQLCESANGPEFAYFAHLYDGAEPVPFFREVREGDTLTFNVKNDGALAYTPSIALRFQQY